MDLRSMNSKSSDTLYHRIKLSSGLVIYLPTSVPDYLHKYVVKDEALEKFKDNIKRSRSDG